MRSILTAGALLSLLALLVACAHTGKGTYDHAGGDYVTEDYLHITYDDYLHRPHDAEHHYHYHRH